MEGLKKFGLGILWALLSPILLVGIALTGLFGIFNFFIEFCIMIVNFFKGKKLFPPFEKDVKAYKILKKAMDNEADQEKKQEPVQAPPQQVFVQQNYYTQPGPMPGIPPQFNPGIPNNPYQGLPNQQPYGQPNQQPYGQPNQQPFIQQQSQPTYPNQSQIPYDQQSYQSPTQPPLAEIPSYNRGEHRNSIFIDDEEDNK